jgi:hypothetical protein
MKKLAALLLVLLFSMLIFTAAYAEGISVSSETGDRVSLFDDIRIDREVRGNVISVLGNVEVDKAVDGQIVVVFGDITVNADVSGQVVTVFGNTKLTSGAVIQKNLITLGSIVKEDGSRVLGQEVRIFGEYMNVDIGALLYLRLSIMLLFSLAVLVIGLLLLVVSRKKYEEITASIEKNTGKKLLLGFLAYLGASILFVLLIITLVAPVLYIVLLVMAAVVASIYLGRMILKTFSQSNSIYMEFITGLISITLIKLLLIFLMPQEGIILSFALLAVFGVFINSIGLGGLAEYKFVKK